ncbi:DNA alkylation repair protein [archaeon]|nr:DNA alkylation repair protein [archaeon]
MQLLEKIKALESQKNKEGMARYGINTKNAYGVSIYKLREIAKETGKDHELALNLWNTHIHEAQLLAALIDEPNKVTEKQMESWVKDLDSWDTCDIVCSNLFDKTPFAYTKIFEWSERPEEFVKRAGFALIATLAIHDKKAPDTQFTQFFPIIARESTDQRNFVKKAVNWALRGIGKRNHTLNKKAIKQAEHIKTIDNKTARWIANDAIRELTSEKIQKRLKK